MKPAVAVVGCGYWGKNLVRNFHALGALSMVCDSAEPGRTTARQLAPNTEVVDTFASILQHPQITAVAIAAPARSHFSLAKAAFQAGKDVFVEKPLCLDIGEAKELVGLAESRGSVLMVGHLLQYHPHIQKLQSLLATGELGKLHYIISNRLNLGKIRREENALWSFAPHDISVILSLANGQLPDTIICSGGTYLNNGVADTTLTVMRFPGGVQSHVFVSWLNPFKEQKLTVVGSAGMAVFDDTKPWPEKLAVYRHCVIWEYGQIPTPNNARAEPIIVSESEPLRNECQHFLDCCRERRIPRTDGHEGLRVLSVLQAAQRSLDLKSESISPALLLAPAGAAAAAVPADYFVHPTAVVDDGAKIGRGTKVWHFSHVMKGAQIGLFCTLGQNVNVDNAAIIGSNVKVQNNVSIYGGVVVEDDVFLGPSCVLTNVTNPRSQVNRHGLYERTLIKRGATIGANATIICGVSIGKYAFVGAGAVVTKDVPDYGLVLGNPARLVGWMSRHGHRLVPDENGIMQCPESGFHYHVVDRARLACDELDEDAPLPPGMDRGTRRYDEYKDCSAMALVTPVERAS